MGSKRKRLARIDRAGFGIVRQVTEYPALPKPHALEAPGAFLQPRLKGDAPISRNRERNALEAAVRISGSGVSRGCNALDSARGDIEQRDIPVVVSCSQRGHRRAGRDSVDESEASVSRPKKRVRDERVDSTVRVSHVD